MVDIHVRKVRTLFLSDVHLGTKGCQADLLLDFLKHFEADTIYLVGDIIDGWRLKQSFYWPQTHNDVVQKLLRKARKGSEVITFLATMTKRLDSTLACPLVISRFKKRSYIQP